MNVTEKILKGIGLVAVCSLACVVGFGIGVSVVAEEIPAYERVRTRNAIKEKYGVDLDFLED